MADKTLEQRIASARQAGYSDAEIYDGIKNSPRYQTQFKNSYAKGMTDAQIAGVIGLKLSAHAPQSQSQQPKNTPKADDVKPEKPSFLVRFGAGMDNTLSGLKQGALYLKDGITGGNEYEKFTKAKAEEKAFYKQAKKDSGFSGIDVAEFLGETVAMGPLATAGKGFKGAKVLSKAGAKVIGQNAGLGAVASAVGFAENAEKRTDNAVMGAVGGGIGSIVGKKIGDTVAKRMNASTQNIDDTLNKALASTGMTLSDLPEQTAKNLRSQAKSAIKGGRALDEDAIRNIAFLESKGFKPTKAQATRNAVDWGNEREFAKYSEPLLNKYADDNARLIQSLNDEIVATGGRKTDDYVMNQDILQIALGKIQSNKAKTRQAYDVAKNADGNDIVLDGRGFVSDTVKILEDNYLLSSMPPQVKSILQQIHKNPQLFTVGKSQELIKVLNSAYKSTLNNGQPTSDTHAIKLVRDVLTQRQDEAMQGLLSNGVDAGKAWNIARQTHKESRQLIDSMPLLKDVERGVEPDKMFKKHILGGNIAEVDRTMKFLETENPQVVADIRQTVIEYIASKSINASEGFSPAGMNNSLKGLGDARLKAIFGEETTKRLKDIQMVGHLLMQDVANSAHNRSNTSSSLVKVLSALVNKVTMGKVDIQEALGKMGAFKALHSTPIAGQKINQSSDMIDQLTKLGWITGVNSSGE